MDDTDTPEAGRRLAADYLRLVEAGDDTAAAGLIAGVTDVRAMAFLGAGLTALTRTSARQLSPAQRAQANGRHMRLIAARDAARRDPTGLRSWLEKTAAEAVFVQQMLATARARAASA